MNKSPNKRISNANSCMKPLLNFPISQDLEIMEALDRIYLSRQYKSFHEEKVSGNNAITNNSPKGLMSDRIIIQETIPNQGLHFLPTNSSFNTLQQRYMHANEIVNIGNSFLRQDNASGIPPLMTQRYPAEGLSNKMHESKGFHPTTDIKEIPQKSYGNIMKKNWKVNVKTNQDKRNQSNPKHNSTNINNDAPDKAIFNKNSSTGSDGISHSSQWKNQNNGNSNYKKKFDGLKKLGNNNGVQIEKSSKPESVCSFSSGDSTKPFKSFKGPTNEVVCMYRESPSQYWVLNTSDLDSYKNIMKELKDVYATGGSVNPEQDRIYGCEYEKELFRARVLKLLPKVTVHFIDFGNIHSYDGVPVCKKLSDALENTPDLAYLVEFGEGTPNDYRIKDLDSSLLLIKDTGKKNGRARVVKIIRGPFGKTNESRDQVAPIQVQNRSLCALQNSKSQSPSSKKPYIQRRYEIDKLEELSCGTIFFISGPQKFRFGIIALNQYGDADSYLQKMLSVHSSNLTPIDAKEGDYVLVPHDNTDHIGQVLNKFENTYYVHFMDTDSFDEVDRVYPLLPEMNGINDGSVLFTISEIFTENMFNAACFFKVNGRLQSGKWHCCLKNECGNNVIADGVIEKPPDNFLGDFVSLFLKSECSVKITAVGSLNTVYLRKSEETIERKVSAFNDKLATLGSKVNYLSSMPQKGDMCCIITESENSLYRRGQVTFVKDDVTSVLLVDEGRSINTHWKSLKELPAELERVPFFAVQVTLLGVPIEPLTQSAVKYLKKLIDEKTEIVLNYERYLENVVLTDKSIGKNINECIVKLKGLDVTKNTVSIDSKADAKDNDVPVLESSPSSKPEIKEIEDSEKTDDDGIYRDEDLTSAGFILGNKYHLFVLHVDKLDLESNFTFWAAAQNDPNFIHVNTKLTEEIKAYCESSSEPYQPEIDEVCLAQFEGMWYRGLVIDAKIDEDTFLIFFVDFGNITTLQSDSIRRMKKKFLKPPTLAYCCTIIGKDRFASNAKVKKAIADFIMAKLNESIENVEICDLSNDVYMVRIPEVDDLFVKQSENKLS